MRTGGGMIAFELRDNGDGGGRGYASAVKLMDYFASHNGRANTSDGGGAETEAAVHLCVSLGAVTTYVQHPASMTHKCIPPAEREAMGITDALVWSTVDVQRCSLF